MNSTPNPIIERVSDGRVLTGKKSDLIFPVLGQRTSNGNIGGAEAEANEVEDGVLVRHFPKIIVKKDNEELGNTLNFFALSEQALLIRNSEADLGDAMQKIKVRDLTAA